MDIHARWYQCRQGTYLWEHEHKHAQKPGLPEWKKPDVVILDYSHEPLKWKCLLDRAEKDDYYVHHVKRGFVTFKYIDARTMQ